MCKIVASDATAAAAAVCVFIKDLKATHTCCQKRNHGQTLLNKLLNIKKKKTFVNYTIKDFPEL